MNKKIFVILAILIIILGISASLALAKNEKWAGDPSMGSGQVIPEEDGTYDVPGHPELKVRVFVYRVKPSPSPTPISSIACGLEDPTSDAVVDPTPWRLPNTTTFYYLNSGSVPSSVGGANLQTIASNAFAQWTNVISNKVIIRNGGSTLINRKALDGKNIISWGRTPGSALAVTYTWYYSSSGMVAEVDTIMNNKFFWTWSGLSTCAYPNSYDAQSILTHELGHWFGLDDEYTSEYTNNTMYGYGYKGDAKCDTLTDGDIIGIRAIYNR